MGWRRWSMVIKAEIVMGAHLVTRHRSTRFAVGMAGATVIIFSVVSPTTPPFYIPELAWLVSGALAAVVFSRPLARGAPLALARQAPVPAWVVVGGRYAGAWLVLGPVVALLAVAGPPAASAELALVVSGVAYAAGVGVATMIVTAVAGASTATWFGLVALVAVPGFFEVPIVDRDRVRLAAYVGWIGVGLLMSAWVTSRRRPSTR